jgi:hypothetical protein
VTVAWSVKAVLGGRRQSESKYRGMNTGLELSSAAGRHVSSHGASWTISQSSGRLAEPPGVMQAGDNGVAALLTGAASVLHDGAKLVTESEELLICVKGWLMLRSRLRHFLTVLRFTLPVIHFPLEYAPLRCKVVKVRSLGGQLVLLTSMPLFDRAPSWGRCVTASMAVEYIVSSLMCVAEGDTSLSRMYLQLRCEQPCPSMRYAMQYCERGHVWFGTRGAGAEQYCTVL